MQMTHTKNFAATSEDDMKQFGQAVGCRLRGGETIELVGDVGAGKTTFTKGLALGMNITEPIQSPTFTISRVYETPHELRLVHYDFYRLREAGIMSDELQEAMSQPTTVTVVEWAEIVEGVLPKDRLRLEITPTSEDSRTVVVTATGEKSKALLEGISR